MLEARDITVRLGKRDVLRSVSLAFGKGRLTVIVGPNGAGKSTLIKALSGELSPVAGDVTLDGMPLRRLSAPALAARRAVVPQATLLSFAFTVRDVVGLGSSVPGFGLAEERDSVDHAMGMADVADLQHQYYTQLSGGERQRVNFARALCQLTAARTAAEKTVLLLDEPTSSLDLPHQMRLMRQAQAEARLGRTVVAVLHDLNLAATWADDVIAIHAGGVAAFGRPDGVFTEDILSRIYGCRVVVGKTPGAGTPIILPQMLVESSQG